MAWLKRIIDLLVKVPELKVPARTVVFLFQRVNRPKFQKSPGN